MTSFSLLSQHQDITVALGINLGRYLPSGSIVSLEGELGCGKTTLVKGIYQGLGGVTPDQVRSPTFTLINEYQTRLPIYHFDFYRLASEAELEELGASEYLYSDGISLIEWGNRFPDILGSDYLKIELTWIDENTRQLFLSAASSRYANVFANLLTIEAQAGSR